MEVLIKIMKLIIEEDGDTMILHLPADKSGYAPKLEITIIP